MGAFADDPPTIQCHDPATFGVCSETHPLSGFGLYVGDRCCNAGARLMWLVHGV